MSEESTSEPPEWFTDLPPYMQAIWVRMGLAPESWSSSSFSYAPEWVNQWQQAAWLGWAAPASLAPFYASTMARTAMRAGWLGDQGMYGYMGRAGEAAGRAQGYMNWAAEAQGPTQEYALSQASLWGARQAYWQTQQQWAPVAEAWGGARLGSFMFPQFGLLRAFGFPFYAAGQRLTAAVTMAPYVQQAIAQDPAALYRIQQGPTFWPGQYGAGGAGLGQTLLAQMISGVGEWTAAQSIIWGIRGGGFNLGTMKQTAAIQLMQAGLGLAIDPAMTLIARQMWGIPTTRQEYGEMGAQMGIGAGLFGAGVLAGRAWGFMPSLARASTSWAPFSIEEAISLQQFFTPEQVLWAPNRTTFDAFLPTRSIIGGPQKWVQQAWNEAVDYPNAGVWAAQRFSRLAALGRVTGSIIGGQIGFEIGAGLGTAYVDYGARRGWIAPQNVGLARAIVPPLAGTAGLMIGSYLGAATPGGWSLAIPYGTYQVLRAGMEPVSGPVPNVPWTYGQTTQAYRWNWGNLTGGIAQAITQAPQDVWSYAQETARWGPTLTPIYQMLDAIGNIGVTASIIKGYQANPENWAYGMRNVPGFGTWSGQATFQDWAMRQYAYNRVGTPFWLTQGYADWQMNQYGMRNVPGFGTRGAASETWSGLPNWMYWQSGNMVDRFDYQSWMLGRAGTTYAAQSVFYRTDATGRLLGERIPWTTAGGFWSPQRLNPYQTGSQDWAAYERMWAKAAGNWIWQGNQLSWQPNAPVSLGSQNWGMEQLGMNPREMVAQYMSEGYTRDQAEYIVHGMSTCFLEGTPVRLPDGSQTPIEKIRIGDQVQDFNPDYPLSRRGMATVEKIHTFMVDSYLEIRFYDGKVLRVTGEHPIFCLRSHYTYFFVRAADLLVGDLVLRGDCSDFMLVKSIRRRTRRFWQKPFKVWNISVDHWHTFFADDVGVHNKGGFASGYSPESLVLVRAIQEQFPEFGSGLKLYKGWTLERLSQWKVYKAAGGTDDPTFWLAQQTKPYYYYEEGPVQDIWAWLGQESRIQKTYSLWAQGYQRSQGDSQQNAREAAYYAVYDLLNQGIIQKGSKYWNLEDSIQAAEAISPGLSLKLYDDSNR